jgi:Ni/Co efflux regulator RcnB
MMIVLALLFGAMQAAPALADPPPGHGNKGGGSDKAKGNSANPGGGNDKGKGNSGVVILEKDRTIIREHFNASAAGGNCPPGLAKKNNGCMPPGQAKKWSMGQAVPSGVTIYALPDPLLVRLTPPPVGYRYGRIEGDVVLVSIQTNVVVAAFAFLP